MYLLYMYRYIKNITRHKQRQIISTYIDNWKNIKINNNYNKNLIFQLTLNTLKCINVCWLKVKTSHICTDQNKLLWLNIDNTSCQCSIITIQKLWYRGVTNIRRYISRCKTKLIVFNNLKANDHDIPKTIHSKVLSFVY